MSERVTLKCDACGREYPGSGPSGWIQFNYFTMSGLSSPRHWCHVCADTAEMLLRRQINDQKENTGK